MTLEVGTPGMVPRVSTPGMDLPMPMVKAGCNDNAKLQVESTDGRWASIRSFATSWLSAIECIRLKSTTLFTFDT